jgi:hypothetical protein
MNFWVHQTRIAFFHLIKTRFDRGGGEKCFFSFSGILFYVVFPLFMAFFHKLIFSHNKSQHAAKCILAICCFPFSSASIFSTFISANIKYLLDSRVLLQHSRWGKHLRLRFEFTFNRTWSRRIKFYLPDYAPEFFFFWIFSWVRGEFDGYGYGDLDEILVDLEKVENLTVLLIELLKYVEFLLVEFAVNHQEL